MNSTLSKILGNSLKTVSNWKKEKRLIIDLLEKYFNKEDLEEFIEKNKVSKYDFVNEYSFVSCINFSEKLKILKNK